MPHKRRRRSQNTILDHLIGFEDAMYTVDSESGQHLLDNKSLATLTQLSRGTYAIFKPALTARQNRQALLNLYHQIAGTHLCRINEAIKLVETNPNLIYSLLLHHIQYQIARNGKANPNDLSQAFALLFDSRVKLFKTDNQRTTPLDRILGKNAFEERNASELKLPPISLLLKHPRIKASTSTWQRHAAQLKTAEQMKHAIRWQISADKAHYAMKYISLVFIHALLSLLIVAAICSGFAIIPLATKNSSLADAPKTQRFLVYFVLGTPITACIGALCGALFGPLITSYKVGLTYLKCKYHYDFAAKLKTRYQQIDQLEASGFHYYSSPTKPSKILFALNTTKQAITYPFRSLWQTIQRCRENPPLENVIALDTFSDIARLSRNARIYAAFEPSTRAPQQTRSPSDLEKGKEKEMAEFDHDCEYATDNDNTADLESFSQQYLNRRTC